jgi:hypothetical protein
MNISTSKYKRMMMWREKKILQHVEILFNGIITEQISEST